MRQGDALGFVGFYVVVPERRGQGHGIAIWRAGMKRLAGRLIGLDGVARSTGRPTGAPGFALAWRNRRYGAAAPRPIAAGDGAAEVVAADALPFADVVAYDAATTAGPREAFLARVAHAPGA